MKIPEKLLKKWELLRSHGDNKKISQTNQDIIEMDVTRAFANGECSEEVFKAMASFYKAREKTLKSYL
jgi:hypothetical protein